MVADRCPFMTHLNENRVSLKIATLLEHFYYCCAVFSIWWVIKFLIRILVGIKFHTRTIYHKDLSLHGKMFSQGRHWKWSVFLRKSFYDWRSLVVYLRKMLTRRWLMMTKECIQVARKSIRGRSSLGLAPVQKWQSANFFFQWLFY